MAHDNVYEYYHQCDKMPEAIQGIYKMKAYKTSQVHIEASVKNVGVFGLILWDFKFCPYCGVKLGEEE